MRAREKIGCRHAETPRERLRLARVDAALAGKYLADHRLRCDVRQILLLEPVLLHQQAQHGRRLGVGDFDMRGLVSLNEVADEVEEIGKLVALVVADDFHEGLQQPVHALVLRPRADRADAIAACLAKRAPGRSQRAQVEINGSIHRFVLRYATDQRSYSAWPPETIFSSIQEIGL